MVGTSLSSLFIHQTTTAITFSSAQLSTMPCLPGIPHLIHHVETTKLQQFFKERSEREILIMAGYKHHLRVWPFRGYKDISILQLDTTEVEK